MKTKPISFRPSRSLDSRLDAMRRRSGLPKSRLVEVLTDEAERMRRYSGIAFAGPDHRRRAWIIGSHLDVWEVIQAWQDLGQDSEATQERLNLTRQQVSLALAYYREFPAEIDDALSLTRRTLDELRAAHPLIEVLRVEE